MVNDSFNPYLDWLGIHSPDATRDHYALLNLPRFEKDEEKIRQATEAQKSRMLGVSAGTHTALWQQLLDEIEAAGRCLLSPTERVAYNASLRSMHPAPTVESWTGNPLPPMFGGTKDAVMEQPADAGKTQASTTAISGKSPELFNADAERPVEWAMPTPAVTTSPHPIDQLLPPPAKAATDRLTSVVDGYQQIVDQGNPTPSVQPTEKTTTVPDSNALATPTPTDDSGPTTGLDPASEENPSTESLPASAEPAATETPTPTEELSHPTAGVHQPLTSTPPVEQQVPAKKKTGLFNATNVVISLSMLLLGAAVLIHFKDGHQSKPNSAAQNNPPRPSGQEAPGTPEIGFAVSADKSALQSPKSAPVISASPTPTSPTPTSPSQPNTTSSNPPVEPQPIEPGIVPERTEIAPTPAPSLPALTAEQANQIQQSLQGAVQALRSRDPGRA
ncbi:MAG: hypothetical protein N2C12_06245, partial [Planctomycetales bacterium]